MRAWLRSVHAQQASSMARSLHGRACPRAREMIMNPANIQLVVTAAGRRRGSARRCRGPERSSRDRNRTDARCHARWRCTESGRPAGRQPATCAGSGPRPCDRPATSCCRSRACRLPAGLRCRRPSSPRPVQSAHACAGLCRCHRKTASGRHQHVVVHAADGIRERDDDDSDRDGDLHRPPCHAAQLPGQRPNTWGGDG